MVLIESDWNLKVFAEILNADMAFVLIESDWNLKDYWPELCISDIIVLIESDWNLKSLATSATNMISTY